MNSNPSAPSTRARSTPVRRSNGGRGSFAAERKTDSQCISLRLSVPTAFALGTSGWALVGRAARGTVARRVLGRGPAGFERGKAVSLQ